MFKALSDFAEFQKWPSIARLSRECVITQKLNGCNGQLLIAPSQYLDPLQVDPIFRVGSRNRWIGPKEDCHGMAQFCYDHRQQLIDGLGAGRHYFEFCGPGIQNSEGLKERRMYLFNTARWADRHIQIPWLDDGQQFAPECCYVVPLIARGIFTSELVQNAMDYLREKGSLIAPGWKDPEGVVIFHTAAKTYFKRTFKNDEGKSK